MNFTLYTTTIDKSMKSSYLLGITYDKDKVLSATEKI